MKEIAKKIPIPVSLRTRVSEISETLKALKPGDSFAHKSRNSVMAAVRNLKGKGELDEDYTIATRVDPLGKDKYRVWRTD
jgi:hypothetical protein